MARKSGKDRGLFQRNGNDAWWIRWTCPYAHEHMEKIGSNKSLARQVYQQRRVAVKTEGFCLTQQREGRIISYTGLAGFRGSDPVSATTELGLVGLTRGIAREYGKYNITANCVAPGGINDSEDSEVLPQAPEGGDPLSRLGRPEEIAFLAVCLASEDAGHITGQSLLANGGRFFL